MYFLRQKLKYKYYKPLDEKFIPGMDTNCQQLTAQTLADHLFNPSMNYENH